MDLWSFEDVKELEESKRINKSLSALGNVINALTDPKGTDHIPYRDIQMCRSCVRSMRKASGLGAQPVWISLIHRCRSCLVRSLRSVCAGAVMHCSRMAGD